MNIEYINEKMGRNTGTELIINLSNIVKKSISSEYVFVRYMGPKFAIAFSGADLKGAEMFVKSIKDEIKVVVKGIKKKKMAKISPKTNFVLATYYKGTGLEEVTKKLEEYLDDCDKEESNISCI